MNEFFYNKYGKSIKNKVSKTKKRVQGQSIYKCTESVGYLKKGDGIYLDNLHKDHLEVVDKNGKVKGVLNLDGTWNEAKSLKVKDRIVKR